MSLPKWLDKHLPPRGPCGICGGPDARHRIIDAIRARYSAGESILSIAADYNLLFGFVRRIVRRKRMP